MNNYSSDFIILAAGKGTRMKNPLSKVLHKIAGRTLVSHSLNLASKFPKGLVNVVVSEGQPDIENEIYKVNSNAKISIQRNQLGTGDAVKSAIESIVGENEFTVILYADTPFIRVETVNKLLAKISANPKAAVCVLGFICEQPNQYGRLVVDKNNRLEKIVEFKEANDDQKNIKLCNSGIFAFRTKHIKNLVPQIKDDNAKKEFYLTDVVEIALKDSLDVEYEVTDESELLGVNSQFELQQAEKLRQSQLRKQHSENGVIMPDPETVYFSEETKVAPGVVIHQNVIFAGNVTIEARAEIKPFTHIESAVIGEGTSVGPFARIRPKTILGKGNKIGNFVEVKNLKTADEVKISHLSYIGDANLGSNVNIGAGTITCNYDGKNKFTTNIEANSFIGSNTSLIAPVNIAEGTIVGAGTTIWKDTAANTTVVNPKTINILKK